MKKSMKAIFIVSILFIIGVGLFGLVNGDYKTRKNSSDSSMLSKNAEETADRDSADNEVNEINEKIETNTTDAATKKIAESEEKEASEDVSEATESYSISAEQAADAQTETADAASGNAASNVILAQGKSAATEEKTEKEQYIERLNSIETYYDELWNKSDITTTLDMKELKNQEYTKWDDELNTIYQMIKKKLPEEEFIPIRDAEREWITQRDETAAQAASKYAGGTMEGLEYMSSMTESTKARTYELVEIYFTE
ncbi:lysozyme inhibitor LprI family protein [Konateibacter massiliensis]|uniref:lysozyme inhibitor LprI family protein n=1 Tax=Konateibacter massiliensis TaxID=2002841 RepID=UPI0015D46EAC|nr:lysozyme inhibitor LprI family protein [Konateibacter massiliensis]